MIDQTLVIFEKEMRSMFHNPSDVLVRLIRPILWILVFGSVFRSLASGGLQSQVNYQQFMLPGILVNAVLVMGFAHGITLRWEADVGILSRMLVAPVWRASIILGKAFSSVAKSMFEVGVFLVFSWLIRISFSVDLISLLLSGVVVGVFVIGVASLGMALAIALRSREAYTGVVGLVGTPSLFASNSLYSLDQMPEWLRIISRANPSTYAVDYVRRVLIYRTLNPVPLVTDLAGVALFAVTTLVLAVILIRRSAQ